MLNVVLHLQVLELATNQALESKNSDGGVDDSLGLCRQADETLTMLGEGYSGGAMRAPSEFSMTRMCCPFMTETHEFVVLMSIPTTGP